MRRIGAVWHRVRQYVKQDLRETLLPSSIPDPPGYVPPPPLTLRDKARRVAHVCRAYIDTWSSAKLQAELVRRQPERAKEFAAAKDDTGEERLSDIMAELGTAAHGGAQAMKPILQRLYTTRAVAYRQAVQQFIEGYKEGFREAQAPEPDENAAGEGLTQPAKQQPAARGGESAESSGASPPSTLDKLP